MAQEHYSLERALSRWVADFFFEGRLPPVVAGVIERLIEAMNNGDVCLGLTEEDAQAKIELIEHGACASVNSEESRAVDTPFVLDASNRLYLNRFYDYEVKIAKTVCEMTNTFPEIEAEPLKKALSAVSLAFEEDGVINEQAVAVATALMRPVSVISGGPGTGKTYTIAQTVKGLLTLDPKTRIALAAPTGKAASRLTAGLLQLFQNSPEASDFPLQATTIHTLLHKLKNEHVDTIIIDEAGMVSLELMGRLFLAAKGVTRFVLVGDKDQLASVDEGAVFAQLSSDCAFSAKRKAKFLSLDFPKNAVENLPEIENHAPLAEMTTWITKARRFRADSGIARLAKATLSGDSSKVLDILKEGAEDVTLCAFDSERSLHDALFAEVLRRFAPYRDAVMKMLATRHPNDSELDLLFSLVAQVGVLAAINGGPSGVDAINDFLTQKLFPRSTAQGQFFAGQILMVRENDYDNELFNGDVGIVLPEENRLFAYFPATKSGASRYRQISLLKLPHAATAFAMTVHKSQGSEFTDVIVTLPRESPILTREFFYTAITRAKKTLSVYAFDSAIEAAVQTRQERNGGLADRLKEVFS